MTTTTKSGPTPPLTEQKLRLIQEMLDRARSGKSQAGARPTLIPAAADRYKPFPVTDLQSAYLAGRQADFSLGNVATHVYLELESDGLDLERLNQAWQKLIERHEALRIRFRGQTEQEVLASVEPYVFNTVNLRNSAPGEVERTLLELRESMSHQVRPADKWPLFEIRAARLDQERYRIFFSIDGLITDARSILVLLQEWSTLYADPGAILNPLSLGFRDYVLAEQKFRTTAEYAKSLEYWRGRLKHLPRAPELPVTLAPGSIRQPRFTRRTAVLEQKLWRQLKARAGQAGLTGNSVALSAFAEVLARWSSSSRFTINVPSFNRLPFHPQVNEIVGEFASFVLLEVNRNSELSFEQRTQALQRQLWADLEQHATGVGILRELARIQPASAGQGMPIVFTSTLGMDVEESSLFATPASIVYGITQTPQVWLDNQVHEEKRGLVIEWDAVESIFPASLLDDMFSSYCDLLTSLAAERAAWTRTGNPALLPRAQVERREKVNATASVIPEIACQEMFEAQAVERPGDMAVITARESLTYGELRSRALQIGDKLREAGARPNTLVAIVMEKGWEQIVGVLGVLYSGAGYVPIDPAVPRERMWHLLAQCEVTQILTQSWIQSRLGFPAEARLVAVDNMKWNTAVPERKAPAQAPDDIAYVIFTSGSTGTPKGAAVAHRGIVNAVLHTNREFGIGPQDRVLALTALHHDMSVFDVIGVLAAGGTLVVPDASLVREPAHWWELIAHHGVTLWNSVPAFMEMLLEHLESRARETVSGQHKLRLAFLGGDWIPVQLPKRMQAYQPGLEFVSVGGPTETTLWNIWYRVAAIDEHWKSIPYGKPIANTRYYILSEDLEDSPDWVAGEMYCAGVGVARGYWNDGARSAEVFIRHPRTGERLYKTGDVGRYQPDGNIEFLGRNDFQVKIMGQRIELGEIEAALRRHPAVRAAVVTAQGELRGRKRLIAYIAAPEDGPGNDELRVFLAQTLPPHSVPAAFVRLDEMPLTSNGKVDRRALPSPEAAARAAIEDDLPRTSHETLIAETWKTVFADKPMMANDNFFELGGDSIKAIQVISRLRNALSTEIPVTSVFQFPVLREFAAHVAGLARDQQPSACTIPVIERKGALPLSFTQQRLWFLHQLERANTAYNMAYAVDLEGVLDAQLIGEAVNQLIARHESLRTAFTEKGGVPEAILQPHAEMKVSIEDLSELKEEEREEEFKKLVQAYAEHQFDLGVAPLLRVGLVRLSWDHSVLLLTVHHIVCDGWSLGILIQELAEVYNAAVTGKCTRLLPLPVQYPDYVAWQRAALQGDALARHLRFWSAEPGPIPVLELPADYARPQVRDYRGSRASIRLKAELVRALKQISAAECSTLTMTLLAAFNILLFRLTGQSDLITGLVTANRSLPEIESLIGCFLNALPLRVRLQENATFKESLEHVRKAALGVYEHQELPFEKLVEILQPDRNLDRSPIFEVLFNTINVPLTGLQLEGVRVLSIKDTQQFSKYALTIYINEWQENVEILIVYQKALFSPQRIHVILDQLCALLEQAVSGPERPITEYSLITQETLTLLPDPAALLDEPPVPTVIDLIAEHVAASPAAMAIAQGGQSWSYQELWARSGEVSDHLRSRGVQPGDVVGVVGVRSFGIIAAIAGVWRASGVLLLLDWNLPPGRHQTMLRESAAKWVMYVGPRRQEDAWMDELGERLIAVDKDSTMPRASVPGSSILSPVRPGKDQPAYIFFTSGTTGTPKGVKGLHKGLGHFLAWQRSVFRIGPDDRCAQLTNLSFDVVLRDIFLAPASGATLVIPEPRDESGGANLLQWMNEQRITVVHTVPTLFESWLRDLQPETSFQTMRWMFFAGEPLSDKLAGRCRAICPAGMNVVNLYGPTETSLAKCFYVVPDPPPPGIQPVGRPMPDTQALVLTASGKRLCGIGELGEIWLRTPFHTAGYINPDPGAETIFHRNPFAANDGAKLYRTGDLGRYGLDGALRIAGRRDHQVKIQGVRVEPNEVKTVLERHPAVESCVVVPWRDEEGTMTLVGFVALLPDQRVTTQGLRSHIGRELPAAMVPSSFVFLKSLPRTPNGKVDQRALPFPRKRKRVASTPSTPVSAIEQRLVEIWGAALGAQKIGTEDNFFELGGHSMLAAQVVAQVRDEFKVHLPLCRLFESPTVASMAKQIELAKRVQDAPRAERSEENTVNAMH